MARRFQRQALIYRRAGPLERATTARITGRRAKELADAEAERIHPGDKLFILGIPIVAILQKLCCNAGAEEGGNLWTSRPFRAC